MENSKKIILDLCGGTGSWSKPYKDAGYDVRIITLPEHDVFLFAPPPRGLRSSCRAYLHNVFHSKNNCKNAKRFQRRNEVGYSMFRDNLGMQIRRFFEILGIGKPARTVATIPWPTSVHLPSLRFWRQIQQENRLVGRLHHPENKTSYLNKRGDFRVQRQLASFAKTSRELHFAKEFQSSCCAEKYDTPRFCSSILYRQ